MIVSRFVSSHASRARLHVNARTHPLRQTLRRVRTVARRGGDSPSQPRRSTRRSPLKSRGVAPMTEAPEPGPHARNSYNDSRRKLIQTGNCRLTNVSAAPNTLNVLICSVLLKGQ